jgi:NlpC/P60 family putative phage cell wall peptidase
MTTPAILLHAARRYIGTPWVHQGRLRGIGIDCIGLLVGAFNEAGLPVKDVANYPKKPTGNDWLLEELRRRLTRVIDGSMQPGDVLCFKWSLHPWHVALLSYDDTMIHAYKRLNECVEQPLTNHWRASMHSIWRWPDWCHV